MSNAPAPISFCMMTLVSLLWSILFCLDGGLFCSFSPVWLDWPEPLGLRLLPPLASISKLTISWCWPCLFLMISRQTSPLTEMLAITFLFLCLVGLSLVVDSRGGNDEVTGDGGREVTRGGGWLCCDNEAGW